VQDGTTVPIYYEIRLAKLALDEEVERKEKLKTKWAQLEAVVGAEKRLALVARDIVEKAFYASRTATGHAKRFLHASVHADPREMIEEIVRAQQDCMESWELEAANRAWDASNKDVRFYPRPL
jgi:type I site-specific restriction-modification system R (restriction) subunit